MVIDVGGPDQDVAIELREARRRRLVALEAGHAVLEEGLARQALQRRQLALVAIQPVGLVAFVQQEAEPGRRGLEHRGLDLRMPLEEARHQRGGHPQRRLRLEVLHIGQERVRHAGGGDGAADQLGAGILLRVARRLQRAAGRERVHAVDHAGLLQGVPDRFIFRLQRVVAHGVGRTDQGDAAALRGDAVDLLGGELRVLHGQQRGEEQPVRVGLGVLVGPLIVGLAEGLGADGVGQPRIGIDVGRDDHDLIDALDVHVPQTRLRLIRTREVEVRDLLLRQRGLRIQIAHVQRALNVVLHARPRIGDHPHRPGNAAAPRRADADARLAVDDQLLGVVVPPDRGPERLHLVPGQELGGAFPDQRRLGDMRVAIEGREILGHRGEGLGRHGNLLCQTAAAG